MDGSDIDLMLPEESFQGEAQNTAQDAADQESGGALADGVTTPTEGKGLPAPDAGEGYGITSGGAESPQEPDEAADTITLAEVETCLLYTSLSQGIMPLISYNYASGNHRRMKDVYKRQMVTSFVNGDSAAVTKNTGVMHA